MKSLAGYAFVGFILGVITAAAGLAIPRNWFLGGAAVTLVLLYVFRRYELVPLRAAVVLLSWVVGSYVTFNYLLPSTQ